jgi:hypothetical protein
MPIPQRQPDPAHVVAHECENGRDWRIPLASATKPTGEDPQSGRDAFAPHRLKATLNDH